MILVAARCKAWVCGRSLDGIAGSNPTGGHGCLSLASVVRSFVQRSPNESGVSDRYHATSRRGGLGPLELSSLWARDMAFFYQQQKRFR